MVVDCETNGLPRDWHAPVADVENWPRVVQVAWATYDSQYRETARACRIVKPDGFRISPEAARVHDITTQRALAEGFPVRDVLYELHLAADGAHHFIAHNASFDGSVLAAEFLRQEWEPPFMPESMICTMRASTEYCRLLGPYGNKWPTLDELYRHLFADTFVGAHDAMVDTEACARCLFELRTRGVIAAE